MSRNYEIVYASEFHVGPLYSYYACTHSNYSWNVYLLHCVNILKLLTWFNCTTYATFSFYISNKILISILSIQFLYYSILYLSHLHAKPVSTSSSGCEESLGRTLSYASPIYFQRTLYMYKRKYRRISPPQH